MHEFVVQGRHFPVLFWGKPLEPSLAGMDNKDFAACLGHRLYKVQEKFPGILLVNTNAALDGDGNGNGVLHGLEAIGHQVLVLHEAGPEVSVLHPVRGTSAIQVDLLKTGGFHQFRGLA